MMNVESVTKMLSNLTPRTLAAIVADVNEAGKGSNILARFMAKQAHKIGEAAVGSTEFIEMVAQAA